MDTGGSRCLGYESFDSEKKNKEEKEVKERKKKFLCVPVGKKLQFLGLGPFGVLRTEYSHILPTTNK